MATPELATKVSTRKRWLSWSYWRGGVCKTSEKNVAYRPTSAVRRGPEKEAAMKGPMARKPIRPNSPPKTASTTATAETQRNATDVETVSVRSPRDGPEPLDVSSPSGSATPILPPTDRPWVPLQWCNAIAGRGTAAVPPG